MGGSRPYRLQIAVGDTARMQVRQGVSNVENLCDQVRNEVTD